MRERRGGRGVGQIVRRHIHGLERRDGTFFGRGDAFLQVAHFRGQRRLITDGARRAAQQRGHFRTGLRETENVVNEQQHVLVLLVAEIFRDGEAGKRHTQTRARRFVHLAIHQRNSGAFLKNGQTVGTFLRMAFLVLFNFDTLDSIISL